MTERKKHTTQQGNTFLYFWFWNRACILVYDANRDSSRDAPTIQTTAFREAVASNFCVQRGRTGDWLTKATSYLQYIYLYIFAYILFLFLHQILCRGEWWIHNSSDFTMNMSIHQHTTRKINKSLTRTTNIAFFFVGRTGWQLSCPFCIPCIVGGSGRTDIAIAHTNYWYAVFFPSYQYFKA